MGLITKGMGVILRNRASKKIFKEASGLQHPVIKSVKPAKDLTKRRKDQQDLFKVVDAQYKKVGANPGSSGASKIKKDAAKKVSDIHDKYEKKK